MAPVLHDFLVWDMKGNALSNDAAVLLEHLLCLAKAAYVPAPESAYRGCSKRSRGQPVSTAGQHICTHQQPLCYWPSSSAKLVPTCRAIPYLGRLL